MTRKGISLYLYWLVLLGVLEGKGVLDDYTKEAQAMASLLGWRPSLLPWAPQTINNMVFSSKKHGFGECENLCFSWF